MNFLRKTMSIENKMRTNLFHTSSTLLEAGAEAAPGKETSLLQEKREEAGSEKWEEHTSVK